MDGAGLAHDIAPRSVVSTGTTGFHVAPALSDRDATSDARPLSRRDHHTLYTSVGESADTRTDPGHAAVSAGVVGTDTIDSSAGDPSAVSTSRASVSAVVAPLSAGASTWRGFPRHSTGPSSHAATPSTTANAGANARRLACSMREGMCVREHIVKRSNIFNTSVLELLEQRGPYPERLCLPQP
jgi:hypothetical protein